MKLRLSKLPKNNATNESTSASVPAFGKSALPSLIVIVYCTAHGLLRVMKEKAKTTIIPSNSFCKDKIYSTREDRAKESINCVSVPPNNSDSFKYASAPSACCVSVLEIRFLSSS